MKLNLLKLTHVCICTTVFVLFSFNFLFCSIGNDQKQINYVIDITIEPAKSYLSGASKITITNNQEKEITFQMMKSLKITKFKSNDFDYKIDSSDAFYSKIIVLKKKSSVKNSANFTINYEGKVFDPPAETNLTQKHSHSRGIISSKSNEGIYLPAGSFYPAAENSIGNYECVVSGPADYIFITSGNLEKLSVSSNSIIRKWKMPFATDEITLVGGKFIQYHKEFDGKHFNLFTYDSTKSADTYLDAVIDHYKVYTSLFGDYPFNMFSIVENFFATGFGMPGYTLLSGKLLAMPWVTLSPGSLAHEFVHNWWGNSVYVDYTKGNWCEALTTFSSNYYFNIVKEKKEGAIDWRKKALMSLDALEPAKNYPVMNFKYQEDMFDAVIGYQKGGFIFYEIMKIIGKDAFFTALKNLSKDFRGKRAYWTDLIDEFVKASPYSVNKNYDLSGIIEKWLNSKELPELRLISANQSGNELQIELSKTTELTITIPIKLISVDGEEIKYFTVKENRPTIKIPSTKLIKKIEIDPEYEVLRKIYDWEKPYSYGRTLSANPLVILPPDTSSNYQVAKDFYDELVKSDYKFSSKKANELTAKDIESNSLIMLGGLNDYKLIKDFASKLSGKISMDENGFKYGGKTSSGSEAFIMFNSDHPVKSDLYATAIIFDGLKDTNPLKRLMHYQSYSLVLLSVSKPGRPLFDMEIFPNLVSKFELQRNLN